MTDKTEIEKLSKEVAKSNGLLTELLARHEYIGTEIDGVYRELKKVVKTLRQLGDWQNTLRVDIGSRLAKIGRHLGVELESADGIDSLYDEARRIVIEAGTASTSFLQDKLNIGYARAARLQDLLEKDGVIGIADGANPRKVLKTSLNS